jgi:hypothetical protein
VQVILSQQKLFNKESKMHKIDSTTKYVSGSYKLFETYENCLVSFVTEFYTKNNHHMIKAVINGTMYIGQFCEEVFDILNNSIGVPSRLVFYRYSKNELLICCVPELWENLDLV